MYFLASTFVALLWEGRTSVTEGTDRIWWGQIAPPSRNTVFSGISGERVPGKAALGVTLCLGHRGKDNMVSCRIWPSNRNGL